MKNIKLAIRNLLKKRAYSIVNIIGLSAAFAISIVLFTYVYYHNSFDKKIPDYKNKYRIISRIQEGTYRASTFAALEEPLKNQPEIESLVTFYCNQQEQDYTIDEQLFTIKTNIYAGSDFLRFFGLKLITGNPESLDSPNSIFLSQQTAQRIFGKEDPTGKVLLISSGQPDNPTKISYTVKGVFANIPKNSHLEGDILLSKKGEFERIIQDIKNSKIFGAYIYVESKHNLTHGSLEDKLTKLIEPTLEGKHGPPLSAFQLSFQPINKIHFTQDVGLDFKPQIKKSNINILLIIGLLVLITVVFNFLIMNISLTNFRWKQTQVISFLGGKCNTIFNSTLWETTILVLMSIGIATFLIVFFDSGIKSLLSNEWGLPIYSLSFWVVILTLSGILIVLSIFTTLPSFRKLKINTHYEPKQYGIHRITPLIIIQFVAVIALVGFNLLIKKQINYINNKELGYNADNVAIFHIAGGRSEKINILKKGVTEIPGVQSAGVAQHYPGCRFQDMNFETPSENFPFQYAMVDEDVIHTLGIKFIKKFNEPKTNKIIINETFYNSLRQKYSEDQIINGEIHQKNEHDPSKVDFKVDGVVADFHYNSLYSAIGNFAFFTGEPQRLNNRYLLIRINQKNSTKTIAEIGRLIKTIYPDLNAEPTFLNEQLNAQYHSEKKLMQVTNLFSWAAIIITCFGLFAFSLTSIQQRTKEIGIRKVNGAKVTEIMAMLNANFIKWVIIAFGLACPVSWFAMHKWLQNFAYKTELSWWVFAAAGVIAMVIALLTVSWQSWKAATSNPVKALRYE